MGDGSGRQEPWRRQEFPGPPRADTPPPPTGGAAGAVPPAWSWARPEGTLLHVASRPQAWGSVAHTLRRGVPHAPATPERALRPLLSSRDSPVAPATTSSGPELRPQCTSSATGLPGLWPPRGLPPGVREGPCRPASPLDQGAPAASSPHPASVPAGGFQRVAVLSPSRMGVGRRVPRSAGGRGSAGLGGASDSRVHPTIGSPHPRRGLSL